MLRLVIIFAIAGLLVLFAVPVFAGGFNNGWLFHETWDNFDWTYPADNPAGSEFAIDADSNLVIGSFGEPRKIYAEKELACPIYPTANFVFEAHVIVDTDPDDCVGSIRIDLLGESDEIVARIAWFDWQANTGYGDLELSAEGGNPNNIYQSQPHGFTTQYATPNHVFRIVREGDEWTGWIDEKRGTTLVYAPTITATKIEVSINGDVEPWTPREPKIDYIKVINSPTFGDINSSGGIDIDDIVALIAYVFQGGAAPCGCPPAE